MKKLLTLLTACVICAAMLFAGCQSTGYSNNLGDFGGEVASNGGFVVEKGNYVYFINGVAAYTDSNEYGKVGTGDLVRIKKSDLANPQGKAETVIPSLFVAGDKTAGFWIFDNEVFYATPTTAKNQSGTIENSKLDFVKTSLDGATSVILKTVASNSTAYRYVKSGSTVYLVMQTVNADSESVVEVYNATENKTAFTTGKITAAAFCDDNASTKVFYTAAVHNEELDQDESYNELHVVEIGSSVTDSVVLSGKGGIAGGSDVFGISGVTLSIIKDTAATLYVKASYIDTTTTTVVKYFALAKDKIASGDGAEAKNAAELVSLAENITSTQAETVFASTSFYLDKNSIVYLDSTNGLLKYDYENEDKESSSNRSVLYVDEDVLSYTAQFISGDYVYFTDSSSYYYRLNLAKLLNKTERKTVKLEKVNVLSNATDWYLPEVVGDYMLSVYTSDPYYSLVFVSDLNKEFTDEEIEKIHEASREAIENNYKSCASVLDKTKTKKLADYLDDKYPED